MITLPASKVAAFLEILQQYDFVKVDKLDDVLQRFIRNAPKNVVMEDEEITDLLMGTRYGKSDTANP